jgi:parallel beta-helix repeat protein
MVQAASSPKFFVNPIAGNDSAPGNSATPFKTIAKALQVAKANDVIQLAAGTYTAASGEIFPLWVPTGVTILGNEANKGEGIRIVGSGRFVSPSFAAQNITLRLDNQSQLRGVTVTNEDSRGTGVWIESTNPTVVNCTLINCKREGIFATGTANPLVVGNVATQNAANGITIARNTKGEWRQNLCQRTGFGLTVGDAAAPLLSGNQMVENRSGMVLNRDCRPVLRNNRIERNTEDGLVVTETAIPDLGQPQDPGGNVFRDNVGFDLFNGTQRPLLSVGNQVNLMKVSGAIELAANEVPPPGPTPLPVPLPTPNPTPVPGPIPVPVPPPDPGPDPTVPAPPTGLTDIQGHWAIGFISALVSRGLISGFPDGTYKPEAPITRSQYAAILAKTFDLPLKRSPIAFSDVPTGFWANAAIAKAYQMGFISGFPDGTFRPNQNLTRVQAIVSLVSGLGLLGGPPDNLMVLSDRAQIPDYATDEVSTALQRRIVVNYPTISQLDPLRDATRAEVAAFIFQSLVALNRIEAISSPYIVNADLTTLPTFTDIQGHWAAEFIQALASQNFIRGMADGTFQPDAPISRSQYASLIAKAFNPVPRREAIAFTDVPGDFWAKAAIEQAYRGGFISGYPDGTFQPNQNILRIQTLYSLVAGLGLPAADQSVLNLYDDQMTIPQNGRPQVAAATARKIVVSYPSKRLLLGDRPASRGEVAAMVYLAMVQAGRAIAINSPYVVGT